MSLSHKIPQNCLFLVGGAVRDQLMGVPVQDHDFVVIHHSPSMMIDYGFSQVGRDFPVFLDEHGQEFALARVERKTAEGYLGFETHIDGVTLEEDLKRRDLTINAMAKDTNGQLIDPFGGRDDLENKILRHVSEAFAEDPVRVLRVARFMARYGHLGFQVAPETMDLMKAMVKQGEVKNLVAERVWMEFVKATQTPKPSLFLRTLHECGALKDVLPEVDTLYGVPQVATYHPEIDTGIHTEMVLDQACKLAPNNVNIAFAALTHDLGKAVTPQEEWPKHHNHEELGLEPLATLVKRWKVPSDAKILAEKVCFYHLHAHRCLESKPGTLLKLVTGVGLNHPHRFEEFIVCCEADKRGRLGLELGDYPQADFLRSVHEAIKSVSGQEFADAGMDGLQIKEKMREARLKAITQVRGKMKKQIKEAKQENGLTNPLLDQATDKILSPKLR